MNGLGQNGYGIASPGGYSLAAGALAEVLLTAMFVFVIFGSLSKDAPKGFAGLSIGIALSMAHILGIPITGTSVNPARSLGPAVFVGGTALAQSGSSSWRLSSAGSSPPSSGSTPSSRPIRNPFFRSIHVCVRILSKDPLHRKEIRNRQSSVRRSYA